MPDAAVAEEAWTTADHGDILVARLENATGCTAPVWAQMASQPALPVFVSTAADAATQQRVLARFRTLPAWRAHQTAYLSEVASSRGRTWDASGTNNRPRVTVWQAAGATRRFALVQAATSDGGCAEFAAQLTAVFELTGPQGLTLLSGSAEQPSFSPIGAMDRQGDGVPEFLTEDGFAERSPTGYSVFSNFAVVYLDCPC
jgi:hypothetical protein